ncbi:MAG TPA: hypothetical protein VK737_10100 [Opitutales bacterium]|jgi:hypothetical protein|nr:hypothetical protein [Opitutales bacterium]
MKPLPCLIALFAGLTILTAQTSSPFGSGASGSVPVPQTPAPGITSYPAHASTAAPAAASAATTTPPAPPLIAVDAEQKTGAFNTDNALTSRPQRTTVSKTADDGTTVSTTTRVLSSSSTKATASTWVDLTIRNLGKAPITNLVIDYTVYVKTTNSSTNGNSTEVKTVRGSATVDVPVNGKVVVKTLPVDKVVSTSATTSIGYQRVESTDSSSYVSDIAGWYVEASYNGTVLKKLPHPDNIQDLYPSAAEK